MSHPYLLLTSDKHHGSRQHNVQGAATDHIGSRQHRGLLIGLCGCIAPSTQPHHIHDSAIVENSAKALALSHNAADSGVVSNQYHWVLREHLRSALAGVIETWGGMSSERYNIHK